MASRKVNDLDFRLQIIWTETAKEFGQKYPELAQPFLTCTHRSNAEQAQLYAKGRDAAGNILDKSLVVTYAEAGESKHNFSPSKAFDIAFKNADGSLNWNASLFSKFAEIAKAKGANWGGDFKKFKDRPHFEI